MCNRDINYKHCSELARVQEQSEGRNMPSDRSGSGWTKLRRSAKMIARGSARRSWYSLVLFQLPYGSGYVIEKISGAKGSSGTNEMWFRNSLEKAERKFKSILRRKLGNGGPRQYEEVSEFDPVTDQLDLWP
jgi:hypothetical protein